MDTLPSAFRVTHRQDGSVWRRMMKMLFLKSSNLPPKFRQGPSTKTLYLKVSGIFWELWGAYDQATAFG